MRQANFRHKGRENNIGLKKTVISSLYAWELNCAIIFLGL